VTDRTTDIQRVHDAHAVLLAHLDAMTGTDAADPSAPSLLPGWTRGHLLTHIAGNARSFIRQLEGAESGVPAERYPGGDAFRDDEIARGAGRSWDELVADVRTSAEELDAALDRNLRWDVPGINTDGSELPTHEVPFRRVRETVVHHADLGDPGYTGEQWPAEYVREELRRQEMTWNARRPMGTTGLPEAALKAPPVLRLQWLLGRAEIDDLGPAGVFSRRRADPM
jgi:maleylpyruvate isomerase